MSSVPSRSHSTRDSTLKRLALALILLVLPFAARALDTYSFGVLSQRSPILTAEYWNPILDHVGKKASVELKLRITRTAPESNGAIARGDYDFVYSNTIFLPSNAAQNYQVILRPRDEAIRGQIVTLAESPIQHLKDLQQREVGFPSKAAFVGYAVPMDHLLRSGIQVQPYFGGNQEGIMGQLKAGKVIAAGVNNQVMKAFAARENLKYRVLWESEPYDNLPVASHPRVPRGVVEAVRKAFVDMNSDPAGRQILEASAAVIKQKPPYGFVSGSQADYGNYLTFYRDTVVKDIE